MTKAQAVQMIALLTEIRDALVGAPVIEVPECPHPEERRISFATFADPVHWVCGVCKYEHQELVRN